MNRTSTRPQATHPPRLHYPPPYPTPGLAYPPGYSTLNTPNLTAYPTHQPSPPTSLSYSLVSLNPSVSYPQPLLLSASLTPLSYPSASPSPNNPTLTLPYSLLYPCLHSPSPTPSLPYLCLPFSQSVATNLPHHAACPSIQAALPCSLIYPQALLLQCPLSLNIHYPSLLPLPARPPLCSLLYPPPSLPYQQSPYPTPLYP